MSMGAKYPLRHARFAGVGLQMCSRLTPVWLHWQIVTGYLAGSQLAREGMCAIQQVSFLPVCMSGPGHKERGLLEVLQAQSVRM